MMSTRGRITTKGERFFLRRFVEERAEFPRLEEVGALLPEGREEEGREEEGRGGGDLVATALRPSPLRGELER